MVQQYNKPPIGFQEVSLSDMFPQIVRIKRCRKALTGD